MTNYVLGFAFVPGDGVVLIRKTKPEWQKGKLNGVGGKIEEGEFPHPAMIREFHEETGVLVGDSDRWMYFGELKDQDYSIHLFTVRLTHSEKMLLSSPTEEKIGVYETEHDLDHLSYVTEPCVPNIKFLIPLALDYWREAKFTDIQY